MKSWPGWVQRLASVELTLACLVMMMFLVLCGTLAQVGLGTYAAQKLYFNSFWVVRSIGESQIPVLPGGLTVGGLWLINLLAAFLVRFRWRVRDAGILLSHAGLILLVFGQFLAQTLAKESQMKIEVGESRNFTESERSTELAIIKTSDPSFDEVTAVPHAMISHDGEIRPPRLPFYLVIRRYMKNTQLAMATSVTPSLATQGIGTRVHAEEIPTVSSDEESNVESVYVEICQGTESLGVWLVSTGLGAPQTFHVNGADYRMELRPKRTYLPYTLTLKAFHHDIYPGTDIPKNFSSLLHVSDSGRRTGRDVLIYMNHPLRYEGRTFYQASFGEGDKMSVLQVMQNPASSAPYWSCAIVVLGLAIQFLWHLTEFLKTRS